MQESLYPIVYNRKHHTVMANDIVKGKQEMTLQEARIIRLLITQVAKEDRDLKTYQIKIQDLAAFLGIPRNNLYRDIQDICINLLKRLVIIRTGNPRDPWDSFQWIQRAKYDGRGTVTLMLSEQIKPYVLELDKYFTQYRLENILEMRSFYAIRLYEIFKADDFKVEEYREYSIDFLREALGCENKYPQFNDFKKRVIDIAIKEINAKSDLEIRESQYVKQSRKIIGLRFLVWDNYTVLQRKEEISGQLNFDI